MITIDLDIYWMAVGAIMICLAGQWGLRRVKGLFSR